MLTKEEAVEFFTNLRYTSSEWGQERKLMSHHIEQFSNALVKFINENELLEQQVKKLNLKKGDILIKKRGFNQIDPYQWREVARAAGIDFNVPIVFVDELDEVQVKNG